MSVDQSSSVEDSWQYDRRHFLSLLEEYRQDACKTDEAAQRVFRPPVDVESIARRLGARVEEAEMPQEGMLYNAAGSEPVIYYRWDRKEQRKRFTIAHEIGHLFIADQIGREANIQARSAPKISCCEREERIANAIAAELLMPDTLIDSHVSYAKQKYECPRRRMQLLSNIFCVSIESLAIRLSNCRYYDYFRISIPIDRDTNYFNEPYISASISFELAFKKCDPKRQLSLIILKAKKQSGQRPRLFSMEIKSRRNIRKLCAMGFWGSPRKDGAINFHLVGWTSNIRLS